MFISLSLSLYIFFPSLFLIHRVSKLAQDLLFIGYSYCNEAMIYYVLRKNKLKMKLIVVSSSDSTTGIIDILEQWQTMHFYISIHIITSCLKLFYHVTWKHKIAQYQYSWHNFFLILYIDVCMTCPVPTYHNTMTHKHSSRKSPIVS